MSVGNIIKYLKIFSHRFFSRKDHPSGILYWEQRVSKFGRRSVLNLGYDDTEYEIATEKQKSEIYSFFKNRLKGNERIVLDFGCGTGRFTADLAKMVGGKAVGIDPIPKLLCYAPRTDNVEYKLMKAGEIPLPEESVDVVWVCLVFGGIEEKILPLTIKEIDRVLKKGGLLFVIENTTAKQNASYWKYYQVEDYKKMISFTTLEHLHDYYDLNERMSIMAGRK